MLSLLTLALVSAAPQMVVVVPVEVIHADAKYAPLARAVQSLIEADLRENGVPVRTEDDLDSRQWGTIKGASHVLAASVIPMPDGKVMLQARLLALPNHILGSTRSVGWNERETMVRVMIQKLGRSLPTVEPRLLVVNDELMLAWGLALGALHDGDPQNAKKRVAEVALKWPTFTPAVERAAQLGK
jgi:hypothetical protein